MALHQQRQAKCREVRAASMAQHLQQQQLNQQKQPHNSSNDTQMADNIREFYRTPTMLAGDEPFYSHGQSQQEHQLREEEHEEGFEQGRGGWRGTLIEEQSSTSYDVNSLVEGPDAQDSRAQEAREEVFRKGDKFSPQIPLWLPAEEDRRTPTLPWTSSLDAETLMEVDTTLIPGSGRRKSTKKTPAPPPPVTRSQAHSPTSPNPENERLCSRASHSLRCLCATLANYVKYYSACRLACLNRESVTSLHRALVQCPKPLSLTSLVDAEVEKIPTQPTSRTQSSPASGFHYSKASPCQFTRPHVHIPTLRSFPLPPMLLSLGPALNRANNTTLIVTAITN
ncbi:hypothetical protein EmuJ_000790000 [Echinococcus multilocularis]|uniref:Uncharacterized protein n=1 Tax=Echinococcus multilocularis TaxID=6211 RepID=A0A068YDA8_ECHMU|nr:hypothetical protein EmuJ_000790000 [Echinococcus multilocularis]